MDKIMGIELYKINFLMNESFERILRWMKKANDTDDKFDEYISLFIATNMTYNLWEKFWKKEESTWTSERDSFLGLKKLIKDKHIFGEEDIRELKKIFSEYNLKLYFFRGKNRKDAENILTNLKEEERSGYAFNLLYSARCNLFHGEKGYEERQIKFLSFCSKILRRILKESLTEIADICKNEHYDPRVHKKKVLELVNLE